MTKIKLANYGWLYLVLVLDWCTKEIIGYRLDSRSRTQEWLNALDQTVNRRFPTGIRDSHQKELFLVSNNGCQPTSHRVYDRALYGELCHFRPVVDSARSRYSPPGQIPRATRTPSELSVP